MFTVSVSPYSFTPNKIGYKKYLKAGGSLSFVQFQVFERRTNEQILADVCEKYHNAMISTYDAMYACLQSNDEHGAKLNEYHLDLLIEKLDCANRKYNDYLRSLSDKEFFALRRSKREV